MLLVMLLSAGYANARPVVELTTHGYVVSNSSQSHKLTEFSSDVAPHTGDLIEWKVLARNNSSEVARRLVTNLAVPSSTVYVSGSAAGPTGVIVAFSVDGGKTFSTKPMHLLHSAHGDVLKPYDVSAYTTVRWTQTSDLLAHSTATFSYEATVK